MSTLRPSASNNVKRVVTGHNGAGQSTAIFVDTELEWKKMNPTTDLVWQTRYWVTQETPASNQSSNDTKDIIPERLQLVEPNGSQVVVVEFGPGAISPMHRTASVDYCILIQGTLTLVLEDGTEETISEPGSVTVQRGTLHRWENRGKEWVRFVAVMIDAKPVEVEVDGTTKTLGDYFPPRPIGAHAASAPKAPGA